MLDVVEQLVCQRVCDVRRVVVVMVTQLLAFVSPPAAAAALDATQITQVRSTTLSV